MKTLGTIAAAVTVAFCFLMVWNDPALVERRQTAAAYERMREADRLQAERREQERREQERDWQQQVDQFAIPLTRVVITAVTIALLVAVPVSVALVLVGITVFMRRRSRLVYPDAAGRVPLQLDSQVYQQSAAATLAAYHETEQERARQSYSVPANYAPHITYAPQYRAQSPLQAATGPLQAAPGPEVVTFASLLSQGRIGKGNPLLLGFDQTGAAIDGIWLDVYSSALAGMPHSGKTTSQRFLACQLALHQARFVVCDPHMQAGDDSLAATLNPLKGIYLCEPADDPAAILQAIRYVDSIGDARVRGRDDSRVPVVLWIDELNGLLADAAIGPELVRLLKETTRQYRKVAIFISAVAHTWSASSTGGNSDLRANFASRMCHRMERQQARLLLPTDLAAKAERLEPGQAVLHSMRYSTVMQVPLTTASDVASIARLLTDDYPTMDASWTPVGRQKDAIPEVASTAPQCDKQANPEQARAVGLFQRGMEVKDVIREMYGDLHSGTREYRERRSQVEAWIREVGR